MASPRYTLNIDPEDLKPEPPRVLTRREKFDNFMHYHKWHFVIGLCVLLLAGGTIAEVAGRVAPDYTIGIISPYGIPLELAEKLNQALTPLVDDRNGDGQVKVGIQLYEIGTDTIQPDDPNIQSAGMTRLVGDVETGTCSLFLVNDIDYYEKQFGLFAYNDGVLPEDFEDVDMERIGIPWGECPLLAALNLDYEIPYVAQGITLNGQDQLRDFTLAKSIQSSAFKKEKNIGYYEDSMKLFDRLTQGAR